LLGKQFVAIMPRILVVEDELLISALIEDWLSELGCEVVGPAHSVPDALDLAANEKIDGAILDFNLAGEDAQAVASLLNSQSIPFVFATGDNAVDPDSGLNELLVLKKPFNFEEMKLVVAKLLDHS
jgi:CheY-like chemotaxis protein